MLDDGLLKCTTPAFPMSSAAGPISFYLKFGDYGSVPVFPDDAMFELFDYAGFDLTTMKIHLVSPGGGAYDQETDVSVTFDEAMVIGDELEGLAGDGGFGFLQFDGAYRSELCARTGTNVLTCPKPGFGPSAKDISGAVSVEYSPNGQCYTSNSGGEYVLYNAVAKSVVPTGAPSHEVFTLDLGLEGCPYPAIGDAKCTFRTDTLETVTPMTQLSAERARCDTPSGSVATYTVYVSCNGVADESFYLQPLQLASYNLAWVEITSMEPEGVPVGAEMGVTVNGVNFADYGVPIVARVGWSGTDANGTVITEPDFDLSSSTGAVELFTSQLLRIELPAFSQPGTLTVSVSLNNGTDGTFTQSYSLVVFSSPTLTSVVPNTGSATGGVPVVIQGSGFTAFSSDPELRTQNMRCRFGNTIQPIPPSFHNDTHVGCITTWGDANALEGESVSISLNKVLFTAASDVRFYFLGLHKPALIFAYFLEPQADRLVLRFDGQVTDRAGMNGPEDCSKILSASTVAQVFGYDTPATERPNDCEWLDDATVVVYLTLYTSAAPGMDVCLKSAIAPAIYPEACGCPWDPSDGPECAEDFCNAEECVTVSDLYPCDDGLSDVKAECPTPEPEIKSPDIIGECPDAPLALDGSASRGGGIVPLTFYWGADRFSDNARRIKNAFAAAGTVARVTLSSSLNDGFDFRFMLKVCNFLRRCSDIIYRDVPRAPLPIPVITINSPDNPLRLRADGSRFQLPAKAILASCFNGTSNKVDFSWSSPTVLALSCRDSVTAPAPLLLGEEAAQKRVLALETSQMEVCVNYGLTVVGCMHGTTICSNQSISVELRNEPLRTAVLGGDRTVGEDDRLTLSACEGTSDPDDDEAQCCDGAACGDAQCPSVGFTWFCSVGLANSTERGACAGVGVPPPSCTWEVLGNLTVDQAYEFHVQACKSSQGGECVNSTAVTITVEAGKLPEITILPQLAPKANPAEVLRLEASARGPVNGL